METKRRISITSTSITSALAAVFHAPGQPFTLESFPLPMLSGGEVLVRILCATICGSDLHTAAGRRISPAPSILGHEMVAEVCGIGPSGATTWHDTTCQGTTYQGTPVQIGDRITWSMIGAAGKFGHEKIAPGREFSGGFAEYCFLPEGTAVFPIPDNLSNLAACPANCATATVAAVFRTASQLSGPLTGQSVVIYGAGMLGLTACAMAADSGAANITVIEPLPHRRRLALEFGASQTLEPSVATSPTADLALEFSGQPESVEQGIHLLRRGGRFILAGAVFPSRKVQIDAEQIVRRMLKIEGVYNYLPKDLQSGLNFLSMTHYPFARLVSAQYPLTQINQAFSHAENVRPPRVALIPGLREHTD
jgi:putative phosphonate catabolism associated alcohol dehydrogenase